MINLANLVQNSLIWQYFCNLLNWTSHKIHKNSIWIINGGSQKLTYNGKVIKVQYFFQTV
jgi:hypothetical protein